MDISRGFLNFSWNRHVWPRRGSPHREENPGPHRFGAIQAEFHGVHGVAGPGGVVLRKFPGFPAPRFLMYGFYHLVMTNIAMERFTIFNR